MLIGIAGVVVAAVTAVLVARVSRHALALGVALVAAGGWLLSQAGRGPIAWPIAVVVGAGSGLMLARPTHPSSRLPGAGGAALALGMACWIGANSTSAQWFGRVVSHGPSDRREVALTFDDGPNIAYTLEVRDVLDRYGVKGTFFTVGKALDKRPDISRALLQDGHLLGNHSYLHDELRWLDPRYPELARTQHAFRRDLGVCPTFYRPPHGQHTPFMAWVVHRHHMTMVTWDASAGDWATHDAALVARRILRKVGPGSIIDLHDGLDGNLVADRSVLVRALPRILDGLRARGLHPVRLDLLLGKTPYAGSC